VSRPPTSYRRRKLRRKAALGLLALVLIVVASGFAYWQDTRFPARSERLAGTPVELRIQDGVKPAELGAIRSGVRATSRFMRRTLGRKLRRHVEARIARGSGCHPFQRAGSAVVGEGSDGFFCIDTRNPAWQWMMLKNRLAAAESAGHEYVHVMQADAGCLPEPDGQHYRWIFEGMAEEIAWRALVAAGRARDARVAREIRDDGAFDGNLEPLRAYERDSGRDAEYALWHFAIRRLLAGVVGRGLAPARRPELSLVRFCEEVAAGRPWKAAFRRSFGLPVEQFYARFEAARRLQVPRSGVGSP
jgi:hypothetical protein